MEGTGLDASFKAGRRGPGFEAVGLSLISLGVREQALFRRFAFAFEFRRRIGNAANGAVRFVPHKLNVVFGRFGNDARTSKALRQLARSDAGLARHNLCELGHAEAAVAATHGRARAPLQRVETQHGQLRVQRGGDIGFGHLVAAAEHMARVGIGRDGCATLFFIHVLEQRRQRQYRVELVVFRSIELFGNARSHINGNSGSGSQARRFKARDIEKAWRTRHLANFEIARIARGAHADERGNAGSHVERWVRLFRGGRNCGQALGGSCRGIFVTLGNGIRANEHVAMHSRRHKHALARFRGGLEHRVREQAAHIGIHEVVFAATGGYRKRVRRDHVMDFVSMHAGGVHHDTGVHRFGNVALGAFDVKDVARAPGGLDNGGPGGAGGDCLGGIGGRSLRRLDAHNFA